MIKRLTVEDVIKIAKLRDDNFKDLFVCDIGEWIQFLVQNVNNPNFFMIGAFKNDNLTGYMIAINSYAPPVSYGTSVLYSKTAGIRDNKKALKEMITWSKEKGATSIDIITNNAIGHAAYGFKKKATVMTLEI